MSTWQSDNPETARSSGSMRSHHPLVRIALTLLPLLAGSAVAVMTDSLLVDLLVVAGLAAVMLGMKLPLLKQTLVAVIVLEIPIQIDIHIAHDTAVAANNSLSGFNLSLTTLCLVILYLIWGVERTAVRRDNRAGALGVWPSVLYFGVVLGSTLIALDPVLALSEVTLLFQALLIFFYIVHVAKTRADILFIVTVLMVGVVVQGLITIGLKVTGGNITLGPLEANNFEGRIGGTLGAPNALGSFMTFMLAPAAGLFVAKVRRDYHTLAAAALLLGFVALTLSLSRGAWLANLVAFAMFTFLGIRRDIIPRRLLWVMAGAGVLVVAFFGGAVAARVAEYDNGAALARFPLNSLAIQVISENPILGVGANNFAEAMQSFLTVAFSQVWISTVHNRYLLVFAETGILGLLTFLTFMITAVRSGWAVWRARDPFLSPLALGMSSAIVGTMFHMLVAIFHARAQLQTLWLIAGLMIAMQRLLEVERISAGLASTHWVPAHSPVSRVPGG